MKTILELLSVRLLYGYPHPIPDIKLHEGSHMAIVGHAGSGKSAMLWALMGKSPHSGSITFHPSVKGKIFIVKQQHEFKNLSNTKDLYYQQRFNAMDSEDSVTVREVLSDVALAAIPFIQRLQIEHMLDQPLLQLSNGEHKKLQLAIVLAHAPAVLLLDEPFVGLDNSSRLMLHQVLHELINQGMTLIIATATDEIPKAINQILTLHSREGSSWLHHTSYLSTSKLKHHTNTFNFAKLTSWTNQKSKIPYNYIIKMNEVDISYGNKKILDHINWKVRQGEKWLIVGPNGSGKSTLLSLVYGDNPQAYANDIILFDQQRGSGESIWEIKKKIGYLSPELHMYFDKGCTVYDTLASGWFDTIGLFQRVSTEQHAVTLEWLNLIDMYLFKDYYINQLSFGQQRTLLLARALIKDPSLLILDEPLQGLNTDQQSYLISLIEHCCIKSATTMIFVSHYPEVRPSGINKYIRLAHGRIINNDSMDAYTTM